MRSVTIRANGVGHEVEVRTNETLVDSLRERLHLKGTKVGCDDGSCGTCTVLLDGDPVYACMLLSVDCVDREIVTIEGLGSEADPHPLQRAFADNYAAQCGFCTPGAIMAAKALLDRMPDPSEGDVRAGLAGVICRCGYRKIIEATLQAASGGAGS
jgi:carbon-monoxide dehydrogenase small subunit